MREGLRLLCQRRQFSEWNQVLTKTKTAYKVSDEQIEGGIILGSCSHDHNILQPKKYIQYCKFSKYLIW